MLSEASYCSSALLGGRLLGRANLFRFLSNADTRQDSTLQGYVNETAIAELMGGSVEPKAVRLRAKPASQPASQQKGLPSVKSSARHLAMSSMRDLPLPLLTFVTRSSLIEDFKPIINNTLMMTDEQNQQAPITRLYKVLVAICAMGPLLLIGWLLKSSAYGFDFTDESFYLLWMAAPHKYSWPASQFGFIYHPLYSLMGGDIPALRQANILITFGLAWSLCNIFLAQLVPSLKESRFTRLTVAAGLATSAFMLFDSSLITPSYNSLNLQAVLITAIGLVLADKGAHRSSIIGWVLIGVGGWLAFMAKPSTALALGVGVFIYLLFARKFSIRLLALTVACALTLLLVSAFLFDGSVTGFINRLQLGIEFSMLQGGGYEPSEMLRIDTFKPDKRTIYAFLLVGGVLLIALSSAWKKNTFIVLLISIAFFALTALLALGQIHRTARFGEFQGLLMFAVVVAIAITAWVLGSPQKLKTVSTQQWAIAALFLITPHLFAFGTNGNYWRQGSSAAIFWLLAGLTLLAPMIRERASWLLALPVAIAVQAITATLLQTGLEKPYRQPQPLRINSFTLEVGPQHSPLVLSQGYADYITNAVSVARKAGLEPKTPMIDLTGQSPGVLFALEAESLGQAWIIGGYPGSLKFAEAALAHTSCEQISSAWILYEPDGPRRIPTEVMLSVGADFKSTYQQVGGWPVAAGAGGYEAGRTQALYKPVDTQSLLMSCQALRQNDQP